MQNVSVQKERTVRTYCHLFSTSTESARDAAMLDEMMKIEQETKVSCECFAVEHCIAGNKGHRGSG